MKPGKARCVSWASDTPWPRSPPTPWARSSPASVAPRKRSPCWSPRSTSAPPPGRSPRSAASPAWGTGSPCSALQRGDEAWEALEPAPALFEEILGDHPNTYYCLSNTSRVASATGQGEAAVDLLRRALALEARLTPPFPPVQRFTNLGALVRELEGLDRLEEAVEAAAEYSEHARAHLSTQPGYLADASIAHASLLLRIDEHERAAEELETLAEAVDLPADLSPQQAMQVEWMWSDIEGARAEDEG